MKGVWPANEIANLPADVAVRAAHALHVPGVDGERHLLVIGNSET
jgi:16S rRNA (guanine527-N7)-methyltransferase